MGKKLIKDVDEHRKSAYSKLTYKKVWVPPMYQPKTSQTCIIFDWDDTLLCTTFLTPHSMLILDPKRKIPEYMLIAF